MSFNSFTDLLVNESLVLGKFSFLFKSWDLVDESVVFHLQGLTKDVQLFSSVVGGLERQSLLVDCEELLDLFEWLLELVVFLGEEVKFDFLFSVNLS